MTEQEQQEQLALAQAMRWGAKGLCEQCGGARAKRQTLDAHLCWMCELGIRPNLLRPWTETVP